MKYYVSLDLGSESMAAFWMNDQNGRGMIQLQEYAEKFTKSPNILRMQNGERSAERSARFLSRIFMQHCRQPNLPKLNTGHDILEFLVQSAPPGYNYELNKTNYEQSLFQYFVPAEEIRGVLLPNLKVVFQIGAEKQIPLVKRSTDEREGVRPDTVELITHLITQVILNFVLKSPEIEKRFIDEQTRQEMLKEKIGFGDIHLTLTVPNVYSLGHVTTIQNFVHNKLVNCPYGIGKSKIFNDVLLHWYPVETVYESDALVYFIYEIKQSNDDDKIGNFKNRITKQNKCCIVTIDVGRGTTDMSFVEIRGADPREEDTRRKHTVLARTGKADGGNRLSYIFAKYYNKQLKRVWEQYASKGIVGPLSFNFLECGKRVGITQNQIDLLRELIPLIEELKKNLKENYEIDEKKFPQKEQEELIDNVINQLITVGSGRSIADSDWKESVDYTELAKALKKAFILPKRLPGEWKSSFIKLLWNLPQRFKLQTDRLFRSKSQAELRGEIEKYVKENITDLIKDLKKMAKSREEGKGNVFHKVFVLVAGQASQFKPIEKTIRQYFSITKDILFLKGDMAKEAVCRGAVMRYNANPNLLNRDEIFGSFGFLSVNSNTYKKVDIKGLNGSDSAEVEITDLGAYDLVYSTRPGLTEKNPPKWDGTTAFMQRFNFNCNSTIKITYKRDSSKNLFIQYKRWVKDPSTGVKKLEDVDGNVKIGNYADIEDCELYSRLWPEVMPEINSKGEK